MNNLPDQAQKDTAQTPAPLQETKVLRKKARIMLGIGVMLVLLGVQLLDCFDHSLILAGGFVILVVGTLVAAWHGLSLHMLSAGQQE